MTSTMPPGPRGPLVSVEGISGVGKTYLTSRLSWAATSTVDEEFYKRINTDASTLGHEILRALLAEARGEHFLRAGNPGTETVLLLAVKTFDFEECLPLLR